MKVIFAGTPDFARVALQTLHAAGFRIPLVLIQPDRPAGRGMKLHASPVKQFALDHGLQIAQPRSLRLDGKYPEDAAAARAAIEAAQADVMVVAAYGLILPQWVLDTMAADRGPHAPAGLGCINIHASLLPRWRGAAPIHRAVEVGDYETGVTIMQMDAGLDTGPMLLSRSVPIYVEDTTGSLHDRLAYLGGDMVVEALGLARCGRLQPQSQGDVGVTYAQKIDKSEAAIDWTEPADVIARKVRAFNPAPGAQTWMGATSVKLWWVEIDSEVSSMDARCGQILYANSHGVGIQCGSGALRVVELQRAGGKRLAAGDFLRGFPLQAGAMFGCAPGSEAAVAAAPAVQVV